MKVKEFMNRNVITVDSRQTLMDVSLLFNENGISGAPVLGPDGKVVGMISDSDLVKAVEPHKETLRLRYPSLSFMSVTFDRDVEERSLAEACRAIQGRPVEEVMSTDVVSLEPEDNLENAVTLMNEMDLNRLPVIEEETVVGIITRADILRCLAFPPKESSEDQG